MHHGALDAPSAAGGQPDPLSSQQQYGHDSAMHYDQSVGPHGIAVEVIPLGAVDSAQYAAAVGEMLGGGGDPGVVAPVFTPQDNHPSLPALPPPGPGPVGTPVAAGPAGLGLGADVRQPPLATKLLPPGGYFDPVALMAPEVTLDPRLARAVNAAPPLAQTDLAR
jgi:hypothetical protein